MLTIINSQIDKSVNLIEQQLVGFLESRYVRREEKYFIAYLSSQTGCNRGCKMCHLTATKQTQFTNCDLNDFVSQLESVLTQYDADIPAKLLHVNFMARGEPLANPTITNTSTELLMRLGRMATELDLAVKFNISTIMPKTFRKTLVEAFPIITPTIYYSMYSTDPDFRAQWLPGAMDVDRSLDLLADYQQVSKKLIKFHGAFISGQNDSDDDVNDMMERINRHGVRGEFNIVRYNPFSPEQGVESERLEELAKLISNTMPVKIIPRVGTDCYASCGQFYR
jgi:adenine C2-methylase RlmN of 23S rRNA A2503 and tRNA A37